MSIHRLTIGKVAEQTGCHIETIRYYEKEGLLPPPGRSEGGHRLYTPALIARLVFIRRSRELGFSMEEIRGLLSVVDGEQVSCEQVKHLADTHLKDIGEKISDLRRMEKTLRELSNQCSGNDVPDCPIIEALQSH
jgi:MerR family mercuric resistance operon transcriptional regulator